MSLRLSILIVTLCALGALLVGCEPTPKNVLVGPRLPIAQDATAGVWTQTPVLSCGRYASAIAAWSEDDVLLVGDGGFALRAGPGGARRIDIPSMGYFTHVVAQRGGIAYAASYNAVIYRYDGAAWSLEPRLSRNVSIEGMWCDEAGTLTVVGWAGHGARRVNGTWQEFDTGAGADLVGLWGNRAGELWAVGGRGVVAHWDGVAWRVEQPLGADLALTAVSGDEAGRLVVRDTNHQVYLFDDGAWRALPGWADPDDPFFHTDGFDGAALVAGRPFAWDYQDWYWWDGSAWIRGGHHGEYGLYDWTQVGDAIVASIGGGGAICLRGGQTRTILPGLGDVADGQATPEGLVLLTAGGFVLREEPDGWTIETGLGSSVVSNRGRALWRLPDGDLLALVEAGVFRRHAGAWTRTPWSRPDLELYPLRDGSLLTWDGNHLRQSEGSRLVPLADYQGGWGSLRAVAGDSLGNARFLFDQVTAVCDGAVLRMIGGPPSSDVSGVVAGDPAGFMLFGIGGLFVDDGSVTRDVTPRFTVGEQLVRAQIRDLAIAPDGDWLVWAQNGSLLRRTATNWRSAVCPVPRLYPISSGRSRGFRSDGSVQVLCWDRVMRWREGTR